MDETNGHQLRELTPSYAGRRVDWVCECGSHGYRTGQTWMTSDEVLKFARTSHRTHSRRSSVGGQSR